MTEKQDKAIASPTKHFFVSMLTRDISLTDAILDLVDNCLDGALRMKKSKEVDYSKHFVKIVLNENYFSIEDNCGGIPKDIAKNYAFKMGREPEDKRDDDDETIGMYGVGMKRAIFKMGEDAKVSTRNKDDAFYVPITADWRKEKEWNSLPILDLTDDGILPELGTLIRVESLYQGVSRQFSNDAFQNDLRTALAEHFTMFLQRGLHISVNSDLIEPVKVKILMSPNGTGPVPYVFEKIIDGVTVSIAVGLNPSQGQQDDEDELTDSFEADRPYQTAGWSVFCNDRAVMVGDKSRLTGWGDGIPLYHGQFSIITGIVEFRSESAEKLPITTTKRALDTSSDVWLQAISEMRDAMRVWINYTNKWKNHQRSDQTQYWEKTEPLALRTIISKVVEQKIASKRSDTLKYNPQKQGDKKIFPLPPKESPSLTKIVFSKPIEDIREVSEWLFDTSDEHSPSDVGAKCFDTVLKKSKGGEG